MGVAPHAGLGAALRTGAGRRAPKKKAVLLWSVVDLLWSPRLPSADGCQARAGTVFLLFCESEKKGAPHPGAPNSDGKHSQLGAALYVLRPRAALMGDEPNSERRVGPLCGRWKIGHR